MRRTTLTRTIGAVALGSVIALTACTPWSDAPEPAPSESDDAAGYGPPTFAPTPTPDPLAWGEWVYEPDWTRVEDLRFEGGYGLRAQVWTFGTMRSPEPCGCSATPGGPEMFPAGSMIQGLYVRVGFTDGDAIGEYRMPELTVKATAGGYDGYLPIAESFADVAHDTDDGYPFGVDEAFGDEAQTIGVGRWSDGFVVAYFIPEGTRTVHLELSDWVDEDAWQAFRPENYSLPEGGPRTSGNALYEDSAALTEVGVNLFKVPGWNDIWTS